MKAQFDLYQPIIGIVTLIIGWLLGLWSNIISEKRKINNEIKEVAKGINVELEELKYVCYSVRFICAQSLGQVNMELYVWMKEFFNEIFEKNKEKFPEDVLKEFKKLDDVQKFQSLQKKIQNENNGSDNGSFNFQQFSTPYMDVKTNSLTYFNPEIQRMIFILKRDINHMNGEFERIWFYNSKTFDSVSEKNHDELNKNIDLAYQRLFERMKKMVDIIIEIQSELKKV